MSSAAISIDAQYRALREGAGLLERGGRAVLDVAGGEGDEFLQGQITNDTEALAPGEGCYAALLDRKGKVRADMRVLRLADDRFRIDLDRDAAETVRSHLDLYKVGRDAAIEPRDELAVLSLLGPRSVELAGDAPLRPEHAHRDGSLAGIGFRVIATDLGVDLIAERNRIEELAALLLERGAEPIAEEAAEIARVESGRPRFGHEIVAGTMPQEAGINDRAVSFSKGCYVGQETVARLHYRGKPNRHLRRLVPERPISAGETVVLGERELGKVGSAVISPAKGPLALAILRREAEPGTEVVIGDGVVARVEELTA